MRHVLYTHERNYGCRITETVYRGLRTVTLENELLRVSFLADKGSDIFEFLHKPTDTDFMWRTPQGVRNPATFVPTVPRPEGNFLDYYEGGWQECLPTGGRGTEYARTTFGIHGEACLIPWDYAILEDDPELIRVRFRVRTYRTPLLVEKTAALAARSGALVLSERLVNEGAEPVDLVWGHHPAFGAPFLDESCAIDLPGGVVQTAATGDPVRYEIGSGWAWPHVPGLDGEPVDLSRVPPIEARVHEMAFLTELRGSWYAITNRSRQVGFGMVWTADVFRALWLWSVFGGAWGQPWYGRTYNLALEPWTTAHPTLAEAIGGGTQRTLAPGEALEAEIVAVAYSGLSRVTAIGPDGHVEGVADGG